MRVKQDDGGTGKPKEQPAAASPGSESLGSSSSDDSHDEEEDSEAQLSIRTGKPASLYSPISSSPHWLAVSLPVFHHCPPGKGSDHA